MVSYALPCPRGSAVVTRSHERCCYRTLKGQTLEGPLIRVSRAVDPFIPNTLGHMRAGSGQRPPRGRLSGNRPFQQQQRTPQRNQTFDSNGPNVRVRGNANQIFERYVALAREAAIGDDRVGAENFYQHAEHYFRIANASRDGNQQGPAPPTAPADAEVGGKPEPGSNENDETSLIE
jgi:Domain of unknown function (DUF4167)